MFHLFIYFGLFFIPKRLDKGRESARLRELGRVREREGGKDGILRDNVIFVVIFRVRKRRRKEGLYLRVKEVRVTFIKSGVGVDVFFLEVLFE